MATKVDFQFMSIEKSTSLYWCLFQGNLQETDETGMFSPYYNVGPPSYKLVYNPI